MKRLLCALLVSVLLASLCSCSQVDPDELNAAVAEKNSVTRTEAGYSLEITVSGTTLYYANGSVAFDRASRELYASLEQTYLAMTESVQNYYSDGEMVSVQGGEALTVQEDADELFGLFPDFEIFGYGEGCRDISVSDTSLGTAYTFTFSDGKKACDAIVGKDMYELALVISDPQEEKTEYSDVICTYIVKEGKIVSCRYEFDVKLFDTPAYVPGYTPPEEEYTVPMHVSAKITYGNSGDAVKIPGYEGETD